VVEEDDVADARHPHLAHAVVLLGYERVAAEALRGRDRQDAVRAIVLTYDRPGVANFA
jgi:hypothetical protein